MSTLTRDEIALAALNGMLSHATRYRPRDPKRNWHEAIAEEAYQIADAMLRARGLSPEDKLDLDRG